MRDPKFDLLLEDNAEEPPKPKPFDPARVAAGILLLRALVAAGMTAGRDGTLCVVAVAAASWVVPARDELRARARGGKHHLAGNCGEAYDYEGTWIAWLLEEQPSAHDTRRAAESFAKFVANGRHCVGISPSPDWLPADLLVAADYRLELPPAKGADVAAVAEVLFGSLPDAGLTDGEAARLTPRLLRLARRMDQTPDGYARKLAELLEQEAARAGTTAAAKGDSPRDEPTLDRMHGMGEAVAWGMALVRDLGEYRAGRLAWERLTGAASCPVRPDAARPCSPGHSRPAAGRSWWRGHTGSGWGPGAATRATC